MAKDHPSRPIEVDWLTAIRRCLTTLLSENSVAELRVLGADREGTVSGYFDHEHRDAMANAADQYSGEAEGVYLTLNPVRPDLIARAANRTRSWAKHTTADIDVVVRRWVPVDFDPVRPRESLPPTRNITQPLSGWCRAAIGSNRTASAGRNARCG